MLIVLGEDDGEMVGEGNCEGHMGGTAGRDPVRGTRRLVNG